MEKSESKPDYSLLERFLYQCKRHVIFIVILLPSLVWLNYVDPTKSESSLLVLLVTRVCRSTIGVMLSILFSKFAFPKMALQTEILEDQNVAVAILFAAIIIGVNL